MEKELPSQKRVKLCLKPPVDLDRLWNQLRDQAKLVAGDEPQLARLIDDVVLSKQTFAGALAARLARKVAREDMPREQMEPMLLEVFGEQPQIVLQAGCDLLAITERDAACHTPFEPLLYYKGFIAVTIYRVAHYFWTHNRRSLALYLQSLCSEVLNVDIHPAARIGCGIMLDHGNSVVIGETAIVEDNVSILHEVTLGGTGKEVGDRHPIVRSGVMIGAGAKLLGRVEIGECGKIGAGSVVIHDVPAHTTVAGVPAKVVSRAEDSPALCMDQCFDDQCYEDQ
ncbi:serine O-acetyltransferase [Persicirhabdus sediminis]|uniref:Serine acetyltransferase n=1 Tax=Persicirhabdus sediminis TaxID=454144 RepID=A0A8J7MDM4_9BACT|nr:serine O-acetyltransferase [Persicirhabdus sediminis]MBK1790700.1 serine O-acetyltransferase [Persicirhabdus sediminis]